MLVEPEAFEGVEPRGAGRPLVPASTVGRPLTPFDAVPRAGLVTELVGTPPGVVVVTAPTGYGKTVALAQWDVADHRPFAWVGLDQRDDDPAHLLVHIATAIAHVGPGTPGLVAHLSGPGGPVERELVPALVTGIEASGALVVVLDDLHLVTNPTALACLADLVRARPSACTLVLAGRSAPRVPLGRLRLAGLVHELDQRDLRFSDDQALQMLSAATEPSDQTQIAGVVARCEGWPAGLHLAELALRSGGTTAGETSFSGRHRLLADYLVEEVLDRLDRPTTTFLEESSVLDRMSAELLDALLERRDSANVLAAIEASGNHFLVPLDEERRWYRYHHLFAELLEARLRDRDPERHRELALRASDLLERDGDVDGALQLAVAADDPERAAALVIREAGRLAFDGRGTVLAHRVSQLDPAVIATNPDAAVAQAWLGLLQVDSATIRDALMNAHRHDRGRPLGDGTPSVAVAAALISAVVGIEGLEGVIRSCDQVRAAGDFSTNPWWGMATGIKGTAMFMLGDHTEARRLVQAAQPAVGPLPVVHAAIHAYGALLAHADGDLAVAAEQADEAHRIADQHDLRGVPAALVVYATDAAIAARRGLIDRARDDVGVTEALLGRLGGVASRTALVGRILLADTAITRRDWREARHQLAEARLARQREPAALGLHRWLEQLEAELEGSGRAPLVTPLTAAELRVLPYLPTHLSLQQIAEALHLSRNTAKSHSAAIYRKLDVTSRSEAVQRARQLGLLPGERGVSVQPDEAQSMRNQPRT